MARIGFSSRRTIAYLYVWTLLLAGLALALRFVPYSDHHGHLRAGWTLVMVGIGVLVIAASIYLIYVLEILKFRRLDSLRLRRLRPSASEAEIESGVVRDLETGEMDVLPSADTDRGGVLGTEHRVGKRQVDQHRVRAEQEHGAAQAPVAADRRQRQRPDRIPG
jgi:hypothetical protein